MLVLKGITKTYGNKTVLNKINLAFKKGEVVGVVGNNGEGKSTLFEIMAGNLAPDDGVVDKSGEAIGYLHQYPDFGSLTVSEFLKNRLGKGDYDYKMDVGLGMVGLEDIDKNKKCEDLSGGQKTKLGLASILMQDPEPTVLILDEPTNNLDLEGLSLLESIIKQFKGTVILTSHDRYFLDNTVQRVLELQCGEIRSYGGNYSFYHEQKLAEAENLQKLYTVQQKKIRQIREDVLDYKQRALVGENKYTSRDPYNKKKAAKAARTGLVRQKKLERLLESEDFIEKPKPRKKYGVDISGNVPQGKLVLEVLNCGKSFDDHKVFENVSFSIRGSERIWVVGKNGSGKTTLLKIAAGLIKPDSGSVRVGAEIKMGFLSQENELNGDNTGIEELLMARNDETAAFHRSSHLHLTEADLRKKVRELSYGQRTKLAFVKLLLEENDLLILDEPTNHLDIETREEIENALQDYKGAMLVASHDRYFIEKLGVGGVVEL